MRVKFLRMKQHTALKIITSSLSSNISPSKWESSWDSKAKNNDPRPKSAILNLGGKCARVGMERWKITFHFTYGHFGNSNWKFWSNGARPRIPRTTTFVVLEQLLKSHFLAKNDLLVPDPPRLLDVLVVPFVVVAKLPNIVLRHNKNAYWRLLGYPRKACAQVMCSQITLTDCGRSEYVIGRMVRQRSFLWKL